MKLSKAETIAIEAAKRNGGKLRLTVGGMLYGWKAGEEPKAVAHTTVKSLVRKQLARYSRHQTGTHGSRYPDEVTLCQ